MEVKKFFNGIAREWNEINAFPDEHIIDLISTLPIKRGDRVLDVACGTGRISGLLYSLSGREIDAIDCAENMIALAKQNVKEGVNFILGDFYDVTGDYDIVVVFDAYPHFLDVERFANACSNSVKKGGYLAVIHDCSRAELASFHADTAKAVSRDVLSPREEADNFKDFSVIKAVEGAHEYILILKKQ